MRPLHCAKCCHLGQAWRRPTSSAHAPQRSVHGDHESLSNTPVLEISPHSKHMLSHYCPATSHIHSILGDMVGRGGTISIPQRARVDGQNSLIPFHHSNMPKSLGRSSSPLMPRAALSMSCALICVAQNVSMLPQPNAKRDEGASERRQHCK